MQTLPSEVEAAMGPVMLTRRKGLTILLGGIAGALAPSGIAFAEVVQYSYDALGRIVQVIYGDGRIIAYAYDAAGNRLQTIVGNVASGLIPIAGPGPVNLRTLADQVGYNGVSNATLTFRVPSGLSVTGSAGTPNGGIAIDSGTWPTGSYTISLTLQIAGAVYGGGGRGAVGGSDSAAAGAAGVGGDAIYCRVPMSIVVEAGGQVISGGGGGGGGGSWINTFTDQDRAGGGGGGGYPNGAGGAAGNSNFGTGAQDGSRATFAGGGGGGAGDGVVSSRGGGAGGSGGAAASAGTSGATASGSTGSGWTRRNPSGGGAAGYAIRKNGHTVGVTNAGTISGSVG